MTSVPMKVIAKIHTDMREKFGIPRQSGLVEELEGVIIFEPEYRNPEALRGMEDFSHLWLLWQFSQNVRKDWSPTVRPPRLGGNERMGVFATRSPFRPNEIGLSCVKLEKIKKTKEWGLVIVVSGVDLLDGTPIFDIKPYIPHVDCKPEAKAGFSAVNEDYRLSVEVPEEQIRKIPAEKQKALLGMLAEDPRPAYQSDGKRLYGMNFAGYEIRFTVMGKKLVVREIMRELDRGSENEYDKSGN